MNIKEVMGKVFTRREDAERPRRTAQPINLISLRMEALRLAVEAAQDDALDHDDIVYAAKGFMNFLMFGEDRNQEVTDETSPKS